MSIASGSSGNCIYIGSERTHILIDGGISNKRIEQGLNEIGVKGSELDGIFITHEPGGVCQTASGPHLRDKGHIRGGGGGDRAR